MAASIGAVVAWLGSSGVGAAVVGAAATAAVTSAMTPDAPKAPELPPPPPMPAEAAAEEEKAVEGMPDPVMVQQAKKKSLTEQLTRRGRASTILTDNSSGKLGG